MKHIVSKLLIAEFPGEIPIIDKEKFKRLRRQMGENPDYELNNPSGIHRDKLTKIKTPGMGTNEPTVIVPAKLVAERFGSINNFRSIIKKDDNVPPSQMTSPQNMEKV